MNPPNTDPSAAPELPEEVKRVVRDMIYFRNKRIAGEPQSDRAMHQFEVEESDELCAALAPLWPTPTSSAMRLSLNVGDILDVGVRLYSVVGVHLGAVRQDSVVELMPLDASRAPYHDASKNAFVPMAMLALLHQNKLLAHER